MHGTDNHYDHNEQTLPVLGRGLLTLVQGNITTRYSYSPHANVPPEQPQLIFISECRPDGDTHTTQVQGNLLDSPSLSAAETHSLTLWLMTDLLGLILKHFPLH